MNRRRLFPSNSQLLITTSSNNCRLVFVEWAREKNAIIDEHSVVII